MFSFLIYNVLLFPLKTVGGGSGKGEKLFKKIEQGPR